MIALRSPHRSVAFRLSLAVVAVGAAGCTEQTVAIVDPTGLMQCAGPAAGLPAKTAGPLRPHPENPRYLVDTTGNALLLVGSHHWQNFQTRVAGANEMTAESSIARATPPLDAYLACLRAWGHNFVRLWIWEDAENEPLPFARTGPALALDGKPRFDLERFDSAFFAELRSRVGAARDAGVYVAVMLFQGWSVEGKIEDRDVWRLHPFHRDNNINGVDGDADGDGEGREVHTLEGDPAILPIQEAYVRRVLATVGDLDNVLLEISNESHGDSRLWQHHMLRLIREHQSREPLQHALGMTAAWPRGRNEHLLDSPADWISPNQVGPTGFDYLTNPPAADGRKVIIVDSDHLPGRKDAAWVWRTFFRGLHPIYMDPLEDVPEQQEIRMAMGTAARIAAAIDLAKFVPDEVVASSGYALVHVTGGSEYLVYAPEGRVRVDLSAAEGPLSVRWVRASDGEPHEAVAVTGGAMAEFAAPFQGQAILHLRRSQAAVVRDAGGE